MKVRRRISITGRASSIANAFVHAIIPEVEQVLDHHDEALALFGMSKYRVRCVYRGDPTTDWDHFKPLVRDARPTGFGHGVRNLVPACGPCNQSKGGKEWRAWMLSNSPNSPTSRKIGDLAARIAALERFEAWSQHEPLDLEAYVPAEVWTSYWAKLEAIKAQLADAQHDADLIRSAVIAALFEADRR